MSDPAIAWFILRFWGRPFGEGLMREETRLGRACAWAATDRDAEVPRPTTIMRDSYDERFIHAQSGVRRG